MASRVDRPAIAFAAFLILLALIALFGTRTLANGSAANMGPGYVPRALAWIILAFGLAIGTAGLRASHRALPHFDLRQFVMVLLSLAVFALLLPKGGLVLASLGTLACSTCALSDFKWRESLLFALVLTTLTVLLFVNGLGLPLPVWPQW
jgi:hypothetical protein